MSADAWGPTDAPDLSEEQPAQPTIAAPEVQLLAQLRSLGPELTAAQARLDAQLTRDLAAMGEPGADMPADVNARYDAFVDARANLAAHYLGEAGRIADRLGFHLGIDAAADALLDEHGMARPEAFALDEHVIDDTLYAEVPDVEVTRVVDGVERTEALAQAQGFTADEAHLWPGADLIPRTDWTLDLEDPQAAAAQAEQLAQESQAWFVGGTRGEALSMTTVPGEWVEAYGASAGDDSAAEL